MARMTKAYAPLLRSIPNSSKLDTLSAEAEILFYRIVSQADDYGRFTGLVSQVAGACVPRWVDSKRISIDGVQALLEELIRSDLIERYVIDGDTFIQLPGWVVASADRAKSRFPAPPRDRAPLEGGQPGDGVSPEKGHGGGKAVPDKKWPGGAVGASPEKGHDGDIVSPKCLAEHRASSVDHRAASGEERAREANPEGFEESVEASAEAIIAEIEGPAIGLPVPAENHGDLRDWIHLRALDGEPIDDAVWQRRKAKAFAKVADRDSGKLARAFEAAAEGGWKNPHDPDTDPSGKPKTSSEGGFKFDPF